MKYIKLSEMQEGEAATVEKVCCKGDMKRRFMDLGVMPGTQIRCLISSATGSIKGYAIKGSVIALRRRDASEIRVGVEN